MYESEFLQPRRKFPCLLSKRKGRGEFTSRISELFKITLKSLPKSLFIPLRLSFVEDSLASPMLGLSFNFGIYLSDDKM